jgi:hypothetical protein
MTEPGCDPDERRTAPVHGVSQTHAVPSRAEAHVLLHSLTVPLTVGDREAARGTVDCFESAHRLPGQQDRLSYLWGGSAATIG